MSGSRWYEVETKPLVPSLREFGELHGLKLLVKQRPTLRGAPLNFYAMFEGVEVKERNVLAGKHGNGTTPEEAVAAYEKEIEGETLVIGAYTSDRREISAPIRFSPDAVPPSPDAEP